MQEQQNINFVLEVEKYPCLYNSSLSSYYRRSETDKAWEEIGKIMNMTAIACKEKWRNLRVVFSRHMKYTKNGSGCKKKKPYYLLDVMQFLTPFVKKTIPIKEANLPSTSSIEGTDNIDDTIHSQEPSNINEHECASENTEDDNDQCSPKPKRKKVAVQEADIHYMDYSTNRSSALNVYHMNDPVTSFLDSLAPELKEMNLQQFKIFKRRVLALVDDIMDTSGATPTSAYYQPSTAADIPVKSQKISRGSEKKYLDVGAGSLENNSNCSSPVLLVEADNIKVEFDS